MPLKLFLYRIYEFFGVCMLEKDKKRQKVINLIFLRVDLSVLQCIAYYRPHMNGVNTASC